MTSAVTPSGPHWFALTCLERTAHIRHVSALRIGWLLVEMVLEVAILGAGGALIYSLYKLARVVIG